MNGPIRTHQMQTILIVQSKNARKVYCNLTKIVNSEKNKRYDVKTGGFRTKRESWNLFCGTNEHVVHGIVPLFSQISCLLAK